MTKQELMKRAEEIAIAETENMRKGPDKEFAIFSSNFPGFNVATPKQAFDYACAFCAGFIPRVSARISAQMLYELMQNNGEARLK